MPWSHQISYLFCYFSGSVWSSPEKSVSHFNEICFCVIICSFNFGWRVAIDWIMIAGVVFDAPLMFGSDGVPDPRAFNALPLTTIALPGRKLMSDSASRFIGIRHSVASVLRHNSTKSNQVAIPV